MTRISAERWEPRGSRSMCEEARGLEETPGLCFTLPDGAHLPLRQALGKWWREGEHKQWEEASQETSFSLQAEVVCLLKFI